MKLRTKTLVIGLTLLSTTLFAQELGLEQAASDFWDEVRSAAPFIFAGIFLVSCFFNIGKITGAERDYKGFLTGVGLFFLGALLIGAVITYLLSLTF